ncbi:MAG: hypothetical protein JEZ11_16820 [Desulfobacterales bacterium]|nr:hypothetical protein [Desulfobacterales bacterium]
MTSMKEYFEQVKEEMDKHQAKQETQDVDFGEAFENGECPYCQNDEFIIAIKRTPGGKQFLHFCPDCTNSWVIEIDPTDGTLYAGPLEIPPLPEL